MFTLQVGRPVAVVWHVVCVVGGDFVGTSQVSRWLDLDGGNAHVEEDAFTAIVVLKSYKASNILHIFFFNLRRKLKRQACELNVGL